MYCASVCQRFINHMMKSSNGNIFCVAGHLCGEFTGNRWIPHTKASDAELWCFFFICTRIDGWLRKQWWGWWFETLSCPLWRHCNEGFYWNYHPLFWFSLLTKSLVPCEFFNMTPKIVPIKWEENSKCQCRYRWHSLSLVGMSNWQSRVWWTTIGVNKYPGNIPLPRRCIVYKLNNLIDRSTLRSPGAPFTNMD